MAPKHAHEAARAKAAREKKVLLALSPLLFVALFFAYHTVTKLHGSQAPTAQPAATTPATTVSTGTPVSATTPATATPLATPPATSGKLDRLPNFAPKDPFHDQGPRGTTAAGSTSNTSNGSTKQQKTKKAPAAPPTTAVIAVNGRLVSVAVGTIFPVTKNPATNGIFKLVGLTAKAAKVAVVGGSYASGAHALTLTVNSVVKLVNTADGKQYTLILYPQGTLVPGAQTTAPPTTTTPTTTTTQTTTTTGP